MPSVNICTVTFNCGRQQVNPKIFARHLSNALPDSNIPEVLVLSLQELAPICYSFLGGASLASYFDGFYQAVRLATESLGSVGYVNFITRNVGMTAIMGFVLRNRKENIHALETGGVGVGVQEMGNKGAVGLRFEYSVGEETMELTVVAAHLAPMEGALERRNQDWKSIVQRLVFKPVGRGAMPNATGEQDSSVDEDGLPLLSETPGLLAAETRLYRRTSYFIFAGDLNYRTSHLKPSSTDFQLFPQPTEDVNNPRHFSHLLKNDQLLRELKNQRTCHGLQEADINFPPTYKYSEKQQTVADVDNGHRWDWAIHRWPSWCDRILYLDLPPWVKLQTSAASVQVHGYTALPLMSTSDHRPVALFLSIPLSAKPTFDELADASVGIRAPFSIDPKWREKRDTARKKELVVGFITYLGLTWEGNGILLAVFIGALGGWAIIRSVLEV